MADRARGIPTIVYSCGSICTGVTAKKTCELHYFQCESDGVCIKTLWYCDGEDDCTDGSDEKHCGK